MAKNKKVQYSIMGIVFFLVMFSINGILFPLSDDSEITRKILIKAGVSSLLGSIFFVLTTYLLHRYIREDED